MYNNKEIVNIFKEAINDTSKFISQLVDYKGKFDFISNQTMDNVDTLVKASECLKHLSVF
jgi:hypothetical protein